LVDYFISLSIVNMSSHCLLASVVSDKKVFFNLFRVPLYVLSNFFSCCFQMFLLYLAFEYDVCVCLDLFVVILLELYWTSQMCKLMLFIKFGVFSTIYLQIFFFLLLSLLPLSNILITCLLICLEVFHISLKLLIFLHYLFLFTLSLLI